MKNLLFCACALFLASCGSPEPKTEASTEPVAEPQTPKSENLFDNPNELASALSQNGIGELKQWQNPMEMGWGSLTSYYPFGSGDMKNNLAYYLEGTETQVTKLTLNLNINNKSNKADALMFYSEVAGKTFTSLNIVMPSELAKAILAPKEYKGEVGGYLVSNELEKSKIETWKVVIKRK